MIFTLERRSFLPLFAIVLLFCTSSLKGAAGIFQTYVIFEKDSGGDNYWAGGFNSDGAMAFSGADMGMPTSSLILKGGEVKTFKNGGSDVTGAEMFYRVYPQGEPDPDAIPFNSINLPFSADLGGGDQRWQTTTENVDLLALATDGLGTYVLEVYWRVFSTEGDLFDSNFGNNITATFEVIFLPVTYQFFRADTDNDQLQLSWQTQTETNNSHFEIERSSDSRYWDKLGVVDGHGTTAIPHLYIFEDQKPLSGDNYYRLRQVDFDGKSTFSSLIVVSWLSNEKYLCSPNPIRETLFIDWANEVDDGIGQLDVYAISGQLVVQLPVQLAEQNLTLNTASWAKGNYIIRLASKNGSIIFQDLLFKQ